MEHRTGRFFIDFVVAAAAILISVASLWVALQQGRIQQRLLSASVWPFLQYGTSDIPSNVQKIDFTLRNAGTGPARVRWATFYYRNKAYATAEAALTACCGATGRGSTVTQYLQKRVLTAGEIVTIVYLPRNAADAALWNRLDGQRNAFHLRACYCSVLDECWLLDSRQEDPKPVKSCPAADKPVFSG